MICGAGLGVCRQLWLAGGVECSFSLVQSVKLAKQVQSAYFRTGPRPDEAASPLLCSILSTCQGKGMRPASCAAAILHAVRAEGQFE